MHPFHARHWVNDEARDRIIPTDQVISLMKIGKDDVIVDVGSGNGYYTIKFALLCSRVYGIDAGYSARDLEELKEKAASLGLSNVEFLRADACDGLDVHDYTHVFFSNSYHDLRCQEELLDKIRANSKVTLIEFKPDSPFGPPSFKKISKEKLVERFSRHGFTLLDSRDFQYHYAVTFQKTR
ncbi:MAG: class I SAM-dependent methyltransferase [TACK group archaeon]|nr:class I SAM-dependent methyltransferase [TACK group archaeon]